MNTTRDNDLVSLYADRIETRRTRVVPRTRARGTSSGIQTFGRKPITRRRPRSMASRRAFTTVMATAIIATSTPAAVAAAPSHSIAPGDTLTGIAEQYGISIDDLIRFNDIENPDQIIAGKDLRVGEDSGEPGDSDDINIGDTIYEIRSGDTLWGVATAHGVSLEELLEINGIDNEDSIFAGDFLVIPTGSPDLPEIPNHDVPGSDDSGPDAGEDDGGQIVGLHLVARGETPGGIAGRYGITVEQLLQANELEPGAMIHTGDMLQIPDPSWTLRESASPPEAGVSESSQLENMPVHQQSLPLSAEAAALSIVTDYWGHQVSEWVFIENMPFHQNPHRGFRGDMNGQIGGTTDYGVYAKPLSAMLANYGFVGEEFFTMGEPDELRERIDRGQPVIVWMTDQATRQDRLYEWHQGERFVLVPQQHVVVAYGYDSENIYVANPGSGQLETYSWTTFSNAWAQFDGMSMAVYPAG